MILVAGALPPMRWHAAACTAVIIASDKLGATGRPLRRDLRRRDTPDSRPRSRSAAPSAGINHYEFGVNR
jgi:hypothetical protein